MVVEHVFHLHKNYLTCSGEMSVEGSNCGGRNVMPLFDFIPNDEKKVIERGKSIKLSKKDSMSPTSKSVLSRRQGNQQFLGSVLKQKEQMFSLLSWCQINSATNGKHKWGKCTTDCKTSSAAASADKTRPRAQKIRPEDQSPGMKVRFHVRKIY